MKKFIKNLKGKKVLSFVLAAIMLATTFNMALPMLKLDASAADITLADDEWGITQTRVVTNYESIYSGYQKRFFRGASTNYPTNFVIPGLSSKDDYTPQGMTYWAEKEWILISAYDASNKGKNSVIYALDAATTKFVALFKIYNLDGTVNTSHGGGIAASKYNFYYADKDSLISYVPLSEMDVEPGTVKKIRLWDSIDCSGELYGAKTSYCCYDNGVLWAGNFYHSDEPAYQKAANPNYNSMLVGYKLRGSSSAEEWFYLQDKNLINPSAIGSQSLAGSGANMNYNVAVDENGYFDVTGSIADFTAETGEITPVLGTADLLDGVNYTLEFDLSGNIAGCSDIYFLRDGGTNSYANVKYAAGGDLVRTWSDDGSTLHCELKFTPGEPIKDGAGNRAMDGNWDTVDDATGTYHIRFDQDNITQNYAFSITNLHISENIEGFHENENNTMDSAGNPTYCIALSNDIDKVQYAMVDKGRIYISRSWSRSESENHIRELVVGDIDINMPGATTLTVNNRVRTGHEITTDNITQFGGNKDNANRTQMLYMGEALCVIDDYLYMFGESAAWNYNGKNSSSVCAEPIDVIWKIDQYGIMQEERNFDDSEAEYYQKINSIDELNREDQYIIVYESDEVDPVTQRNVLYALDSYGGYGDYKLPKSDISTQSVVGDSLGVIGYEMRDYSVDEDNPDIIYIDEEDDAKKSIHWSFEINDDDTIRIENKDLYYSTNKYLYFGSRIFTMSTNARTALDNLRISSDTAGEFKFYYDGKDNDYYLWCNDGLDENINDIYTNFYSNHGRTAYTPTYNNLEEISGTFHMDSGYAKGNTTDSGNLTQTDLGDECENMHIYKRVYDPYTSTYESRIYTDLDADLQPNGTYTINLETYAINERQYQHVDKRPTDFIFVLDTSGSMSKQDCDGYHRHNSFQLVAAAGDDETVANHTSDSENSSTTATFSGNMWIQHEDGVLCTVSVKVQGDGYTQNYTTLGSLKIPTTKSYHQKVYLWYTHPETGNKYWYHPNSTSDHTKGGTWSATETTYAEAQRVSADSKQERYETDVFAGVCYEKRSNSSRLSNMQIAVNQLIWKIQNESANSGLDHRIAIVQYGSNDSGSWTNMGMYTNNSTTVVPYKGAGTVTGDSYRSALHSVSQFGNARDIVNNLTASGDTFVDFGMDMAYNIVTHAGSDGTSYLADGNRSACIIMITDGCPGFGGDDHTTANTVADAAIKNAYNAKMEGAYVYSVQIGANSMTGFDMDKYMDYVSSEFVYAQDMLNCGERNIKDIDYRIDVPIEGFSLDRLVSSIFNSVTSNSTNALIQLDANSIIREHLTDAFVIPDDAKFTVQTAESTHDGIGRLSFKAPVTDSSIVTSIDKSTNTITATRFDYSTQYISTIHEGKKLLISIEGVLANPNANLVNTSINEGGTTAIYQDSTYMSSNSAAKRFPEKSFTIPEYTYVLDYGLDMLDTNVNGTLCAVSDAPTKQNVADYNAKKEYTQKSANGLVKITDNSLDLLYHTTPTNMNDSGYCLIQRDDGTYDWFEIKIVPASNVYFEEDDMVVKEAVNTTPKVAWEDAGKDTNTYRPLTEEGDVVGFDNAYDISNAQYSNGNALTVTVNSTNKNSEIQTFDFVGTGIDIVSRCAYNTGMMLINIKQEVDGKMKTVKAGIVDTYCLEGPFNQTPIFSWSNTTPDPKTGKIPALRYTVEISALYLPTSGALNAKSKSINKSSFIDTGLEMKASESFDTDVLQAMLDEAGVEDVSAKDVDLVWFDDNSIFNGGTGVAPTKKGTRNTKAVTELVNYIDGFRIYNPLGTGASVYTEKNVSYANVIDNLAATTPDTTIADGIAFITGILPDLTDEEGKPILDENGKPVKEALTFANYESVGPTGELYLNGKGTNGTGNAISFKINRGENEKVMLGLRAVNGTEATNIYINDGTGDPLSVDIKSATEMYYDITECIDIKKGEVVITITNNHTNNILAINHIKFSGGTGTNGTVVTPRSFARSADATEATTNKFLPITQEDLVTIEKSMSGEPIPAVVKNGVIVPIVEEEVEIPEDNTNTDNDNTNDGADTEESENEEFSIFSLIEMLIAFIEKILYNAFGAGSIA